MGNEVLQEYRKKVVILLLAIVPVSYTHLRAHETSV